jgi:hypothetical protein
MRRSLETSPLTRKYLTRLESDTTRQNRLLFALCKDRQEREGVRQHGLPVKTKWLPQIGAQRIPHHKIANLIIAMHKNLFEHKREFHCVSSKMSRKCSLMNRSIPSPAEDFILFCKCRVEVRQRGRHLGCHRRKFCQSCDDTLITVEGRYPSVPVCSRITRSISNIRST